jgi:crossover junction endodeoxyribonuclease RusA
VIVVDFPPSDLSAHAKGNSYYRKAALTKVWRAKAVAAARKVELPKFADGKAYTPEGDIPITITFYPPDYRGDRVNFPARCKAIVDGVAEALGVNDARFVPRFEFRDPEKPGRVEITIG